MATDPPTPRRGRRGDAGSVLLLMPVALLVVFLLGGIAIDAAQQFEAQRQTVADAQSIANDAVSALSHDVLRGSGAGKGAGHLRVPIDSATVSQRIAADIDQRGVHGTVSWSVSGDSLSVTLIRRVRLAFAPRFDAEASETVRATASAQLVDR